jgi:hypothetical protein
MVPPAVTGSTRGSTARAVPRPLPSGPRRPPLRVFEPAPRRRTAGRGVRRSTVWVSGVLVVGSLLAVVVGDALVTEGQVRLSTTQREVAAATASQKALQVAVAQKAAPPVVVEQAKSQGMVAPSQVVYLPRVSLSVPLPIPQVTPAPVVPAAAAKQPSPAGAGAAAATPASTAPAGR